MTGQLVLKLVQNEQSNGHDDGFKEIMEQSLREAVEIMRAFTEVPFQNEDIQKIASCLLIARTRVN